MNKLAFRLAAILIVASGAALIAEVSGQRWAAEHSNELVQQIAPGARYATASYSFWGRHLVLEDVALEMSPAAATFRARRIEVGGLIPFLSDLGVATLAGEGVELRASDGGIVAADRLRVERPQPIAPTASSDHSFRLASARRLEAHGVHATRAQSSETVAIDVIVADDFAGETVARIRAMTIAATLTRVRPDPGHDRGKVRLQLDDIELDGLRLEALGKALAMIGDQSAAGAETPVICEAVVINGAKIESADASITAAHERASRPRLRPFGWPKQAGTGAYVHQILPWLLPVVQVDHLEATDVAMTIKEPAPFEGSVGHISVDETGDAATMRVDQFSTAGADGSYIRSATLFSRFGVVADGLTARIELDDVAWGWAETGATSLTQISMEIATAAERPFDLSLTLAGLQLPATLAAELGYPALALDGQWRGSYDQRRGIFRNRIALTARDAGTLNLLASLGYVSSDPSKLASATTFREVLGSALATIAGLTIARAEMRYEDASFTNRLLAFYATKAGQDKETFRDRLIARIKPPEQNQSAPPSPELEHAKENVERVDAFLQNPQTLVVTLEPPRPVSWLSLFALGSVSPEQQVKFFGLSVK